MKLIFFASLLFVQQNGPIWNPTEVPQPIPVDICVEAHITEKGRKAGGKNKISIYNKPLDSEDIRILTEMRKRGLAILRQCSSADS